LAGKREGFKDQRGEVFFEIPRIVKVKRPQMLLLENVPGIFSHDGGRTFKIILDSLEEVGYLLEWQVLNSRYFGVPQNRERVFIIGHLRGGSTKPIFPITKTDEMAKGENTRETEHLSLAIDANYWKGPDKHGARTVIGVSFTNPHNSEEERKMNLSMESRAIKPYLGNQQPLLLHNVYGGFNEEKPRIFENYAPTIRTPKGGGHLPFVLDEIPDRLKDVVTRWQTHSDKEWLKSKDGKLDLPQNGEQIIQLANRTAGGSAWRKEVPTLDGSAGSIAYIDNYRLRTLTPTECERLQGFPDNWTRGLSDKARYEVLGRAVTVNVIDFLGRRILAEFTNTSEEERS